MCLQSSWRESNTVTYGLLGETRSSALAPKNYKATDGQSACYLCSLQCQDIKRNRWLPVTVLFSVPLTPLPLQFVQLFIILLCGKNSKI